jgi:L-histidine N-alpha-methyltransferase
MAAQDPQIDVHTDHADALAEMASEVREGLTSTPKRLPSKYFYDERGSRLFERITDLPEYYLTRAEQRILEKRSADVARLSRPIELVELGSGSAKKTRLLIDAARAEGHLARLIPVEVSQEMAEQTAQDLAQRYPGLAVHAVVGDFEHHLDRVPSGERPLVAFLGSTIGNFPEEQAVELLGQVKQIVGDEGAFLMGTDLVKDESIIEAAYNDSQGITAEFNRNILNVINDALDGDFDPRAFDHVSFFNEEEARIETYLRARTDQSVRLETLDIDVDFQEGEEMRTEISRKYTRESVERMLHEAGLELEHWFTDDDEAFALSLSRRSGRP